MSHITDNACDFVTCVACGTRSKRTILHHDLRRFEIPTSPRWRKRGVAIVPTKFGISFTAKFGIRLVLWFMSTLQMVVCSCLMVYGDGGFHRMCQIAAKALGVHEQVRVTETATDKVPNFTQQHRHLQIFTVWLFWMRVNRLRNVLNLFSVSDLMLHCSDRQCGIFRSCDLSAKFSRRHRVRLRVQNCKK